MMIATGCATETVTEEESTSAALIRIKSGNPALNNVKETYNVGALEISVVESYSDNASHATVRLPIPAGYRLLGGGARVNWSGAGNLLTGIWPDVAGSAWVAESKDHLIVSPASITAQAIVARMTDGSSIGPDDYIVVRVEGSPTSHPEAYAALPDGFILVGGGARDNWDNGGAGNILTASFPEGNGWRARGKDHGIPSAATVSAFAIGLRASFLSGKGLHVQQKQVTSASATNWPSASCSLDHGYRILGGGARTNWSGGGQLLNASAYGDRHTWSASSKDHVYADPGTVTAYCVGVSF